MAVERDTVTFVCTGNTCRSPMAEALLRATLVKRGQGLEKLKVASFGLAAEGGQPPSANSVKAMQRIGLDVSGHRSRLLSQADVDRSIVIFGMTESHLAALHSRFDVLPAFVPSCATSCQRTSRGIFLTRSAAAIAITRSAAIPWLKPSLRWWSFCARIFPDDQPAYAFLWQ